MGFFWRAGPVEYRNGRNVASRDYRGLLLFVTLFCIYGFMATWEPLPRHVQITWRLVYGGLIVACVAGIAWQVLPRRPKS